MKSISSYRNLTWSQYFGFIQNFKIPGSPDDDDGNWVFAQNILPAGKGKQTWVCHRQRRRRINKPKKACWCVTCPCLLCLWRTNRMGTMKGTTGVWSEWGADLRMKQDWLERWSATLKAMKDTHLVWGAGEALCWDIEKLLQILTQPPQITMSFHPMMVG